MDFNYETYINTVYKLSEFDYTTGIEGVYNTVRTGITILVVGGATLTAIDIMHLATGKDITGNEFSDQDLKDLKEGLLIDAGMLSIGLFSKIKLKNAAKGAGPKVTGSETFSNWDDMKSVHKGTVTDFVKTNKPKGSPVPRNWFDKGGSLVIESLDDGTQVWKYSLNGQTISYVPQVVNGQTVNVIKFSDEYLHGDKDIASFTLEGGFSGDRVTDKQNALNYLQSEGYDKIPSGYVLHHDITNGTFQLVQESVHNTFSHYGGYYYNK